MRFYYIFKTFQLTYMYLVSTDMPKERLSRKGRVLDSDDEQGW
jgi:hypothetical protein